MVVVGLLFSNITCCKIYVFISGTSDCFGAQINYQIPIFPKNCQISVFSEIVRYSQELPDTVLVFPGPIRQVPVLLLSPQKFPILFSQKLPDTFFRKIHGKKVSKNR
jgi:hypothetical protein